MRTWGQPGLTKVQPEARGFLPSLPEAACSQLRGAQSTCAEAETQERMFTSATCPGVNMWLLVSEQKRTPLPFCGSRGQGSLSSWDFSLGTHRTLGKACPSPSPAKQHKLDVCESTLPLEPRGCGLNVCIPLNSHVEALTSNGMVFRGGAFGGC